MKSIILASSMVEHVLKGEDVLVRQLIRGQSSWGPFVVDAKEMYPGHWRLEGGAPEGACAPGDKATFVDVVSPYHKHDLLYVKEPFIVIPATAVPEGEEESWGILSPCGYFRATHQRSLSYVGWQLASEMPLWASRLFVRVLEVEIERVPGEGWAFAYSLAPIDQITGMSLESR
jgi:hypothetical protein